MVMEIQTVGNWWRMRCRFSKAGRLTLFICMLGTFIQDLRSGPASVRILLMSRVLFSFFYFSGLRYPIYCWPWTDESTYPYMMASA